MKKITNFAIVACFAITASSCATQQKVQTELYFGLSQSNGNIITDSTWNNFVQTEIARVFATGFTVINSEGKWMDEAFGKLHSEPSRIVSSVSSMTSGRSLKIDSLRQKYKSMFQQESVLRIDKQSAANF